MTMSVSASPPLLFRGSVTRQGMPACGDAPAGSCSSTPFSEMSMTWQRSSACVVISSAPEAKATRAN